MTGSENLSGLAKRAVFASTEEKSRVCVLVAAMRLAYRFCAQQTLTAITGVGSMKGKLPRSGIDRRA